MGINEIIQLIAATLGTLGFAILFNIRGKKLIGVTLGGLVGWGAYLFAYFLLSNEIISYFISAVAISLYAEITARIMKCPVTLIITSALIPLVPGASLYYTMAEVLSDGHEFGNRAFRTLGIAAALAGGIIVSTIIAALFAKTTSYIREQRKSHQNHRFCK